VRSSASSEQDADMEYPLAGSGTLTLAADFPAADRARWRALVDKALKGADFERRLVRATHDGIPVQPLYTADDAAGFAGGLPGAAPFTRGATAAGTAAGGWDIRQRHAHPDPAVANAQILEDLERGATSIQLRLDQAVAAGGDRPDGVLAHDLADLKRALAGVHLNLAPVGLEAGARFAEAADLLLGLLDRRALDPAAVRADLNGDPLGAAVSGAALDPEAGMRRAVDLAMLSSGAWPGVTAMVTDGRPYHAGGASEAQELGCAVATGVLYLRAATEAGLPADQAARQIGFALATDADFFLSAAKFRALRRLWGRVLEVAGAAEAMGALRVRAETAPRMLTRRDPHVNLLRGTVAAFAAAAGGATSVTVLPFDHALGLLPDAFARRTARNTQLVLLEESNLGRVIDPAGGSWYVESLTERLAHKAWAVVQEIERRGGMLAALREGWPQAEVARTWAERRKSVATRRDPVTGVSEFPDLAEPPRRAAPPDFSALVAGSRVKLGPPPASAPSGIAPIPAHRLAEDFERLRDRGDATLARTGERRRVFLCNLGRPAEFTARASFARNLFEAGGFAPVASEPLAFAEEVGHAFEASGAKLAAICSSDAVYADLAEGAARALKRAGCARVYLMGRPDPAQRDAWQAAGVDEFVYAGADVLDVLERAHAVEAGEAA
jgi:methylmalonyl-CoA mutase